MECRSGCQGLGGHTLPTLPLPTSISEVSSVPSQPSSLTPSPQLPTGDGRRVLSLFHQKGLQDFDTLLLSGDGGTLYVGAREAILALNIQDPGMPKLKNMVSRPGVKGMGWGRGGGRQCLPTPVPGLPTHDRLPILPGRMYPVCRTEKRYHSGLTTCWYPAFCLNDTNCYNG